MAWSWSRPAGFMTLLVTLALLGGVASGCGDGERNGNVEVVNPQLLQAPNGDRLFAGTLVNGRSSTIGIAEVEVALYAEDGSQIETMRIQVQDIAPQDSAEFKQVIDSDRPIQQAQVQNVLIP